MDEPRNSPGAGATHGTGETRPAATLPVCAWCKRVRSDEGAWAEEELGATRGDEGRRSHGLCPECFARLSR